jgi:hypothetical protein
MTCCMAVAGSYLFASHDAEGHTTCACTWELAHYDYLKQLRFSAIAQTYLSWKLAHKLQPVIARGYCLQTCFLPYRSKA